MILEAEGRTSSAGMPGSRTDDFESQMDARAATATQSDILDRVLAMIKQYQTPQDAVVFQPPAALGKRVELLSLNFGMPALSAVQKTLVTLPQGC